MTAVFTGISAAASRVVTIALLVYVALVGRSNLLDYLSVAVVASNADGGVGEFLLDLHAWGEDDAACGDEGGTYEVNLLNGVASHTESHGSETWDCHTVTLSGPCHDDVAQCVPRCVYHTLWQSGTERSFLDYLVGSKFAVELWSEHECVAGFVLVERYVTLNCLKFHSHNV